jgi:hypothetical protein
MRIWILAGMLAGLAGLAACDSETAAGEAGEGGEGGNGAGAGGGSGAGEPVDCDAPETSCPASMPFPGGPCEGSLSCDYTEDTVEWAWSCDAGRWDGAPNCDELLGGCPISPAAEACADPFSGSMSGAVVEVGPVEAGTAFRAFTEGEEPNIQWGGQGSAMVFYRVAIDGDEVPSCVDVDASLTPVGLSAESISTAVRLRCGESLRLYLVVPFGTCEETENIDTVLRVAVDGIGETEVTLSIPPDAFCGGFG